MHPFVYLEAIGWLKALFQLEVVPPPPFPSISTHTHVHIIASCSGILRASIPQLHQDRVINVHTGSLG